MFDFMQAGGIGMGFILLLGLATLGFAGSFAWSPAERKLAVIRPLSVATTFATLTGLFSGVAATLKHITQAPVAAEAPGDVARMVMIGLGESLCNPILGFGLLMAAWMLTAVGLRRQL